MVYSLIKRACNKRRNQKKHGNGNKIKEHHLANILKYTLKIKKSEPRPFSDQDDAVKINWLSLNNVFWVK